MLERLARLLVDLLHVLAVDLDRTRMSKASARLDMSSQTGECCQPGVDSAQWLFSQTKTVFVFQSWARLSDSWKVPVFVAPSPKNATRDARLVAQLEREPGADERRQAAADDGVRAEVAALDVVEVHRAAVAVRAALDLPVELGHDRVRVRAARERVPVRAVRRGEDVAVLHRAQTPTATASWPIATCRKPGSSPARNRSSTFSSKRRISSISRRKSRSVSSGSARLFSTFATERSVRFAGGAGRAMERDRARAAGALGRRAAAADARRRDPRRPGGGAARPGAAVPLRAARAPVLRRRATAPARARRRRGGSSGGSTASASAAASSSSAAEAAPVAAAVARPTLPDSWAARSTAAARLERPLRRGRAALDRLPRARGAPAGADQPAPRRRQARAPLPLRAHLRLRRLARDGAALPRALRRRADPRRAPASCASSPTPIRCRRRARSGRSPAGPSDGGPTPSRGS